MKTEFWRSAGIDLLFLAQVERNVGWERFYWFLLLRIAFNCPCCTAECEGTYGARRGIGDHAEECLLALFGLLLRGAGVWFVLMIWNLCERESLLP